MELSFIPLLLSAYRNHSSGPPPTSRFQEPKFTCPAVRGAAARNGSTPATNEKAVIDELSEPFALETITASPFFNSERASCGIRSSTCWRSPLAPAPPPGPPGPPGPPKPPPPRNPPPPPAVAGGPLGDAPAGRPPPAAPPGPPAAASGRSRLASAAATVG